MKVLPLLAGSLLSMAPGAVAQNLFEVAQDNGFTTLLAAANASSLSGILKLSLFNLSTSLGAFGTVGWES